MNQLQNKLLEIIQSDFPIERRPFSALAQSLSSNETEIINLIDSLKQQNLIRRIGPFFSAAHLGYFSTLVAAHVPVEKLPAFTAEVNSFPGVSHNYGRDHHLNVWFTLTVRSQQTIGDLLSHLRAKFNLDTIYSLPALKMFKLNTHFDFDGTNKKQSSSRLPSKPAQASTLTESQIALIRLLQQGLAIIPEPFIPLAASLNLDVDDIIQQINDWKSIGLIRRFGAALRHHQLGFTANAMIVFQVEPENIDRAGFTLARFPSISHCYQRATTPDWSFNLYAMTHARDDSELCKTSADMVNRIKPLLCEILATTAEYKKQSVQYFME